MIAKTVPKVTQISTPILKRSGLFVEFVKHL